MIVAESKLRAGDIAGAMALVNDLRKDAGVALRNTAVTADSAWTYLKLETLLEVYLEGAVARLPAALGWSGERSEDARRTPRPAAHGRSQR